MDDRQPSNAEPVATERPRSRRALLAGALGGLGAWAAASVARVQPAAAIDGSTVVVGGEYGGSSVTAINVAGDSDAIRGSSEGAGSGLRGLSNTGSGVFGSSKSDYGVAGESQTGAGVRGQSASGTGVDGRTASSSAADPGVYGEGVAGYGVWATSASNNGVYGHTNGANGEVAGLYGSATSGAGPTKGVLGVINSPDGIGVEGYANIASGPAAGVYGLAKSPTGVGTVGHNLAATGESIGVRGSTSSPTGQGVVGLTTGGQGVRGQATNGAALYGTATTGYALRTSGRLRAEKVSGLATIGAGKTSATVTPGVDVTTTSLVLLTARTNIGTRALWVTTDATANRFTIRLSSSRTSSTQVGWLLLG